MIYSATCRALYHVSKTSLLASSQSNLVTRTVETSEPSELDESTLIYELDLNKEDALHASAAPLDQERSTAKLGGSTASFAKPRGPARKR